VFAVGCAPSQGSAALGGFAAHPDPDIDAPWPAPALDNIVPRLRDDPRFADDTEIERFILNTTKQGRPGTPMPAWGAFYGGGMTDQEIESIVAYIFAIQLDPEDPDAVPQPEAWQGADGREIFAANCVRCHGEFGEGGAPAPSLLRVFARYGASEVGDPGAEAAVRFIIENGIIVPGGTPMPRWENKLTSDAIDRVIDYLWTIQEEPT
jgi:cytochrome c oxidase cbb3-type subunit III